MLLRRLNMKPGLIKLVRIVIYHSGYVALRNATNSVCLAHYPDSHHDFLIQIQLGNSNLLKGVLLVFQQHRLVLQPHFHA